MNCNEVLYVCVLRITFIFSSSREVSHLFSSSAGLQIYTQTPMISANSYLVLCRKIIPVLPQHLLAFQKIISSSDYDSVGWSKRKENQGVK